VDQVNYEDRLLLLSLLKAAILVMGGLLGFTIGLLIGTY
jgi:hypothetical protein